MNISLKDRLKEFIRDCVLVIFSYLSIFIKYEHKDIAIMRMDEIGDFVIWLACVPHIKSHYKNRRITLICNSINAEIAQKYDYFDEIIVCKLSAIDLFKKLCNKKFNLLIQPMYSRNPTVEWASALIKATEKIAIDGDSMNSPRQYNSKYKANYDCLIKTPLKVLPELKRNFVFLENLFHEKYKLHTADLSVFCADEAIKDNYFIVNLGARCNYKRWYVDRFYAVAEHLYKKTGLTCVLIGTKNEQTYANEFMNLSEIPVINMVGKTNLQEMINLINWAKFVFCNDTSTVHIAAACLTKCFCIVNGLVYRRFPNYPCDLDNNNLLPDVVGNFCDCYGCILGLKDKEMLSECKPLFYKDEAVPCVSNTSVKQVVDCVDNYLAYFQSKNMAY